MATTAEQDSVNSVVTRFIDALAKIEPFPAGKFSDRLFNKIRLSEYLRPLRDDVTAESSFGDDAESSRLHGKDTSDILDAMAAQALATAIASLEPSIDPYGFASCVNHEQAKGWFEDSIIRIAPFLLAEHIESQLKLGDSSLPPIQELCNNSDFVQNYHERLKNKQFIQGTILKEVVEKSHHHSTNLLFMLAYFESKLDFDTIVTSHDVWARKIGDVGAAWIAELMDGLKHEVEPVATHICHSFSPVFAYAHNDRRSVYDKVKFQSELLINNPSMTSLTIEHPASNVIKALQDKLTVLESGASANWKAVQDHLWNFLNASASKLHDAVRVHATKHWSSEKYEYGLGWSGTTTTTVHGANIADLIDKCSGRFPTYFPRTAPPHESKSYLQLTSDSTLAGQWCLVAGTAITTADGTVNVEDLEDGATIISHGSIPEKGRITEYARVSNETRQIPVKEPKIYGINGSKPFFTPSHVFHTTSGLRAIDVATASKANPTETIGLLREGHKLLRLNQDQRYEMVEIDTLNWEIMKDIDVVYDVHLSEGRSYHANGYLTSVSYPEISLKQVAAALLALSPRDRLKLCYKFPELQNILSQCDEVTLSKALTREIKREIKRRTARLYNTQPAGADRVSLMDIDRTFRLFDFHGTTTDTLPTSITVHEGVIMINGEVITRADIIQKLSAIIWSRQTENGRYEHGRVELDSTGIIGRGGVAYCDSNEPNEDEVAESLKKTVWFRVTAVPSLQVVHEETALAAPSATADAIESMEVQPALKEPQVDYMMASNDVHAEKSVDQVIEDIEFTYTMEMDQGLIAPDQDTSLLGKVSTPVKFGNVILKITMPNGPKGIKVLGVSIPHLNRLTEAINNAAPEYRRQFIQEIQKKDPAVQESEFKDSGLIDSLYTSSVVQNEKGQLVAHVRMVNASALAQLADSSNSLGKVFEEALPGTNVSVPLVFQELQFTIQNNFLSAQGAVYEWDPAAKGMLGKCHYIHSTIEQEEQDAQKARRSETAGKAGEIVSSDPRLPVSKPQEPPSTVAGDLVLSGQLDCESLMNLENYSEFSVHKITGSLLQETLRYHMEDGDRATFIPGKKNENLPIELREKLPGHLKTWIATKYNKGYISFLISQGVNNPFDEKQSAKLWYWWQGSGPDTLKKSTQYAEMNRLVGIYAMRQLYQKHLDPYIQAGGKYWADELKKTYQSSMAKRGLLMSTTTMKNNGTNTVNKICNLMNALDPDGSQAKSFYKEFLDFGVKEKFFTSPLIGGTAELESFMGDAMSELILMALNKDERLDADLREAILNDIEPLRTQKEASVQTQVKLLQSQITFMTTLVAKHIASITKAYYFRGIESMFQQIEDNPHQAKPVEWIKRFKAMRVCAMIALIGGGIVLAVNTFIKWKDMDASHRGLAICSILQALSSSIHTLNYFKKNPLVEMRRGMPGGIPEGLQRRRSILLELADAQALQQDIQQRALLPDDMGSSQSTAASSRRSSISSESSNESFDGFGPIGERRPKFNLAMGLLKALDILVGIGFCVFLSIQISESSKSMNDVEFWLSILQATVQGLIAIVDIATLGIEIAVSVGWMVGDTAAKALCCLATVGAILGVIAIVVMFALIIYEIARPKPETEAQKFANANKDLVNSLPSPPAIQLSYEVSSPVVLRGSVQDLTVVMTNKSAKDVTLQKISFYFMAGGEEALFNGQEAVRQDWNSPEGSPSNGVGIRLQAKEKACGNDVVVDKKPEPSTTVCLGGNICGQQVTAGQRFDDLYFKPGDWAKLLLKGTMASKAGTVNISFVEYSFPEKSAVADLSKVDIPIMKL